MKRFHISARTVCICLLTLALSSAAFAADISVSAASGYCFSSADFTTDTAPEGIYLSCVPDESVCSIRCGERTLRSGDVIAAGSLCSLTLQPVQNTVQEAELVYRPISGGTVGARQSISLRIRTGKNSAPVAESMEFETYKNIANSAALPVSDPDGDTLSYTLVKEPKRGTVELHEDGTFTYTPKKNKVGKDSFTFTATDAAGNVSNEGTVSVQIVKPLDAAYYADMQHDGDEYLAMWLKDSCAYTGRQIVGNLCFEPEATVERGEFLAMAMTLLDRQELDVTLTSGFTDEQLTPQWLQPYIVSAFKGGMISGVSTDEGLLFRPSAAITGAEAAVMLQNMLRLPAQDVTAVFSPEDEVSAVPVWAQSAVSALSQAGAALPTSVSSEPLTRRQAAALLYSVCKLPDSAR